MKGQQFLEMEDFMYRPGANMVSPYVPLKLIVKNHAKIFLLGSLFYWLFIYKNDRRSWKLIK